SVALILTSSFFLFSSANFCSTVSTRATSFLFLSSSFLTRNASWRRSSSCRFLSSSCFLSSSALFSSCSSSSTRLISSSNCKRRAAARALASEDMWYGLYDGKGGAVKKKDLHALQTEKTKFELRLNN